MTRSARVDAILSKTEEFILGVLLTTASFILFANVVARYVFNSGFCWAEELVRYEIIWMVFLGGSVAVRQGLHIGVDLLVRVAPLPLRKPIVFLINGISLVFCCLIAFYGFSLVGQTRTFGQVSCALQVPMWAAQTAIPLGAGFMALRFSQQIWRLLAGDKVDSHVEGLG
jgi:C4-dicarboxylate transporter, DctQ subunit